MEEAQLDPAESLRAPSDASAPDPRMQTRSLQDHHGIIAQFSLNDTIPEAISIHFETAKNLYLYSWFVYRFHMVAEQYVFSTLEMALRTRLEITGAIPVHEDRHLGLAKLLKTARQNGLIGNDRFRSRHAWAMRTARHRFALEEIDRMVRDGLDEIESDESQVQPTEQEMAFDWLDQFIFSVPKIRNIHAHGTSELYPTVLWTFEIVVELVNQLFPAANEAIG
jgi:hypothetical protein